MQCGTRSAPCSVPRTGRPRSYFSYSTGFHEGSGSSCDNWDTAVIWRSTGGRSTDLARRLSIWNSLLLTFSCVAAFLYLGLNILISICSLLHSPFVPPLELLYIGTTLNDKMYLLGQLYLLLLPDFHCLCYFCYVKTRATTHSLGTLTFTFFATLSSIQYLSEYSCCSQERSLIPGRPWSIRWIVCKLTFQRILTLSVRLMQPIRYQLLRSFL